jgi:hypothetical protein
MSIEENKLTPAERELEAALGRLRPVAPAINMQQIATLALVRRERTRTRMWQAAAAIFALAAGAAMILRPKPAVIERLVRTEATAPAVANYDVIKPLVQADFAYLKLRKRVMSYGVDAISDQSTAATAQPPIRVREQTTTVTTPWYVEMLAGGRS